MQPRFSNPRHRKDWISYKKESQLAEGLDDEARVAETEEMYLLYLMFQRTKSTEQLEAEASTDRQVNAWKLNPRYRWLLREARGDQDSR